METIKNYFFRDMGVLLGRSMRHFLCNMRSVRTVSIMPIAFILLFIYVVGGAILTLEELFKWKR